MERMISYVIPCYRSEKTIKLVVEEIVQLMNEHKEDEYEIILVNDSSPDDVWKVITELSSINDNIIGIDLAKNFGQHAALLTGYNYANGDVIVSLDDDGQIAVEDTYKLVDRLYEGYDVVYGRYHEQMHSKFRNMGTKMSRWMSEQMIGVPKTLVGSSFFVARKFIIKEMIRYPNAYVFLPGLVFRATDKVDCVYVGHRKREIGRSGYTFSKLVSLWINGATTFSIKPLRLSTLLGFLTAITGLICSIVVVVKKILYPDVMEGWSSLMAVTLILCGMILIVLGMLGEYVGRLYMSSNHEPQYVIRQTTTDNKDES